ncbi:ribonuclease H-like domain-containing protein [Flavobacterium sp. ABG]|uniref:ribonuclease H-like domain-containing protein n=1 Tax=Flavobacterium sp. ABG TaxID=1423322 RepID=UPI00069B3D1A|nr:ribonuclease H-like domain-containing protein [Flavobacterium sp. ABG]
MEREKPEIIPKIISTPFRKTAKGKIYVTTMDFINFLQFLNFCKAKINEAFEYIQIKDNIVKIVDKSFMIQTCLEWLENSFENFSDQGFTIKDVHEAWVSRIRILMDEKTLYFLPTIEFSPHFDTEKECFLYFKNTAVKIDKETIVLVDYQDLNGHVLEEQIIDRDFEFPEQTSSTLICFFQLFVRNISNQLTNRINAFESILGYLMHRFQNPAKSKAVILLDGSINELNIVSGGTGKSLFVKALSFVRIVCDISGKDFDIRNIFSLQRATPQTNIAAINDAKENQNFESFYGRITDGFTINKKYKPEIYIPFNRAPKMLITSNYMLRAPSGNSTERRRYEIEFSEHYGEHLTVYEDFGHYFFDDWDRNQWNEFSMYMMCCIQKYLNTGLIEASSINLKERRLINDVGIELIEFLDEELLRTKRLHKKELFQTFIRGGYVSYKYLPTQKTFTTRIKKYFEYKEINYIETPSNSKVYFEVVEESSLASYTTIKDVTTDYRIVDTANKMTRLVKELKKHFSENPNGVLALDLETTGLDAHNEKIVCMALTFKERRGYNIIFPKHRTKVNDFIKPIFHFLENENIIKVFHNAKFDLKFLQLYEIAIGGTIKDTIIMDYLLDPNRKTHGLKEISKLHLNYAQVDYQELTKGKSIREVPPEELTQYACEDTDQTFQLYHYINNELKSKL